MNYIKVEETLINLDLVRSIEIRTNEDSYNLYFFFTENIFERFPFDSKIDLEDAVKKIENILQIEPQSEKKSFTK